MTTIGGAVRAAIVASGLVGEYVYRDIAPPELTPPYVVFTDLIGDPPDLMGDSVVISRKQGVQVDLYQAEGAESDALLAQLKLVLDSNSLPAATQTVLRCRLDDTRRMPEPIYNYIRHMLSLSVTYEP